MNAVDTNVLIYAHDPRDPTKQSKAQSLLQSVSDGVLIWQVACEYLSASRKLEPFGYKSEDAWADIIDLRNIWLTVLPAWNAFERAHDLFQRYSLSYWDTLLLAACLEAGIERLYSEDFGPYPNIDGLDIVNPFA